MSRQIGKFTLVNDEKVHRVIHGTIVDKGRVVGGVGEDASDDVVLAEYDKLGGLVMKDGLKVKTGAFYDFQKKVKREKPEVSFEMELDGDLVEVTEKEAKGIKTAREKKEALKAKKRKRGEEVPKGKKRIKMKDLRDDE